MKSMLIIIMFFNELQKYSSITELFMCFRTLLGLPKGSEKNGGRRGLNSNKEKRPQETPEERKERLKKEKEARKEIENNIINSFDTNLKDGIDKMSKEKLLIIQERKNIILNGKFKMASIDESKRYFSTFSNIKDSTDEAIQKLIENILINENWQIVPNYSLERDEKLERCEEIYGSIYSYNEDNKIKSIRVKLVDSMNVPPDLLEKAQKREEKRKEYPVKVRKIKEFDFQYKEYSYEVENTTLPDGSKIYAQSSDPIAPPHKDYSYLTFVNIVLLVVNFAIPMHRVGKMLSDIPGAFSVNGIWEMILYVAERLEPIYKQLAFDLNKCTYLQYDDVNTRVLYDHSEDENIESQEDLEKSESIADRINSYLPKLSQKKSNSEKKEKIYSVP